MNSKAVLYPLIYITCGACLLASCFPPQTAIPALPKDISAIAVMPTANNTNDLEGPPLIRSLIENELWNKGYALEDSAVVDRILKEKFGITDGGQLTSVNKIQLGKEIRADAFLFSVLEEFNAKSAGFVNERVVELHLILFDASTGQTLWRGSGAVSNGDVTLSVNEAKKRLLENLKMKFAENLFRSHLLAEAEEAARRALAKLPDYR